MARIISKVDPAKTQIRGTQGLKKYLIENQINVFSVSADGTIVADRKVDEGMVNGFTEYSGNYKGTTR